MMTHHYPPHPVGCRPCNDCEERAFWDAHIPPGTIVPPPVEVPDRSDEPF